MGTLIPSRRRAARGAFAALAGALLLPAARAQAAGAASGAAPAAAPPLFLAQLSLGPRWDAARPPQEQPGFREHSANLARMRRGGALLFGARTRAKGVMILTASDLDAARREFADDPMVQGEAFLLEVEALATFHRGALGTAGAR